MSGIAVALMPQPIAELNALSGNAVIRTYVWGLDLSGSLSGAGGLIFASTQTPNPGTYAPAYDGNGNIIGYVDMATGAKSATYDYNAFGETIIADGPAANAVPFKFSTKYQDTETSHYYYGYRCYAPESGRWLSRDPMGEMGGMNLYGFVSNNAINAIDPLGLYESYNRKERVSFIEYQKEKPSDTPAYKDGCYNCYYYGSIQEKNGGPTVDARTYRKSWARREISRLNVTMVTPTDEDSTTVLQVEYIVAQYQWTVTQKWKVYQKITCVRPFWFSKTVKGDLLRDEVHEGSLVREKRFRTKIIPIPPEGLDWTSGNTYPVPDWGGPPPHELL